MVATTVRDTFRATDPTKPLASDDLRYVDLTDVRGNDNAVRKLFKRITWSDTMTCQLFTGHRGCGKSTELLRLKAELEKADYAVIYFEADEVLDLNDLAYSDLLVAIAKEVYDGLLQLNIGLDDNLINAVSDWFAEIVEEKNTTRSVTGGIGVDGSLGVSKIVSPLASLLGTLTGQLQTGIESKKQVRKRLDPQISQLIDNVNLLLIGAKAKLIKQGKQGLVVIVDNLDRMAFRSLDGARNTHDALYIEHGEQLSSLDCDIIYTVPISMIYSPRVAALKGFFGDEPVIVPMIKIRDKDNQPWETGLASLRNLLSKRIDLEQVFEDRALDMLLEKCGGHPRELMVLIRSACLKESGKYPKPIDVKSAKRAVDELVTAYSRIIPEEHFPLLAAVHRSKQVKNDKSHQEMLHYLFVLEYPNGAPSWHDVHPVILELPKFKDAMPHDIDA